MKPTLTIRWTTLAGVSLAGAILSPGGGGVAWAATYAAVAEVRLLDTPTTVVHVGSDPQGAFAADVGGPANTHAAPTASATVAAGGVHLSAIATAQVFSTGAVATVYSSAEAQGGFGDQFVISAPGLAGTLGTATVALVVSGNPDLSGGPAVVPEGQGWGTAASWRARFSLFSLAGTTDGVTWEGDGYYDLDSANYLTGGSATLGTQLFTLTFVFGGTLDVSFSGKAEARAGASSVIAGNPATLDAFGAMYLGNTIAWGGITELRDANGAAVTDFDATSIDTGFNYAHAYAVPEPAACAMLLCLGGPGLVARRNRRKG